MAEARSLTEAELQVRRQRNEEIRDLFAAGRNAWSAEQPELDVPERLYHYTTVEGLVGIVQSGTLWASDVRYLNDYAELKYATSLIEDEYARFLAEVEDREVAERLEGQPPMRAEHFDLFRRPYVACLTEKGDLLSQWRGYGRGQAVFSLGFDLRARGGFDLPEMCFLAKVVYDEKRQREVVQQRLQGWMRTLLEIRSKDYTLDELFPYPVEWELQAILLDLYLVLKHPAFAEEEEWRLIKMVHFRDEARHRQDLESDRRTTELTQQMQEMGVERHGPPLLKELGFPTEAEGIELKFRPSSIGLVPYVLLPLKGGARAWTRPFPLREVIHGPSEHPGLSLDSLAMFLEVECGGFPTVRASQVPLRF